jgi:hypothetical protein
VARRTEISDPHARYRCSGAGSRVWLTISDSRFRSVPPIMILTVYSPCRQRQVPQIDGQGQDDVVGILRAVGHDPPGRAADLRPIGRGKNELQVVLAVSLVGAQPQSHHEGEMRVLERHRRPAQARDSAAQDVELLAGLNLGRVGEKGVLDLRHGPS